jgi:hypothetical protein
MSKRKPAWLRKWKPAPRGLVGGRTDQTVLRVHPEGVRCPVCTRPGQLFAAVHHKGPSCIKCRAPFMQTVDERGHLFWRCPQCHSLEPMDHD